MKNCMTYALELENMNIDSLDLNLWYSRNPESQIREKCQQFNRSIRQIESDNSPLEEGEWMIVFFGFIPYHYDYEGRPDMYDYHFIRRKEDQKWYHRTGIGGKISEIEENLFSEYLNSGYPPQYFAVKQVEV